MKEGYHAVRNNETCYITIDTYGQLNIFETHEQAKDCLNNIASNLEDADDIENFYIDDVYIK